MRVSLVICSVQFFIVSQLVAAEPNRHRGLLPKEETGALRFLEKNPEFDGRGVVVAIFDTGVDPGAPGLATTTDGRPKIIDIIDGTGSGDVDTSNVRKLADQPLKGLTGRELKWNAKWNNSNGEVHLGIVRAFDIFPGDVVARLKRERRKKWDRTHRRAVSGLRKQIDEWDTTHPKPTDADRATKADLPERLRQLTAATKSYNDPGPVYDCVVFHDSKHWRAIVDTDEDGDLTDESALTNFHSERQYATFDQESLLNFSVNIYDEGNTLSVVIVSGAHGTHVAGIVAGNFPDQAELNGIAPGAQIVSVKIGDTRLDGMEVGAGLIRGIPAVLRNKCDLINMSYGEPTTKPNRGRLVELFSELVDKHGVIFCAAAGNDGPALSTLIAPGGSTTAMLGVGAYISPAMMAAQYSLRIEQPPTAYTWTSRGPTKDGALGVDIFAPGGAYAPVPTATLRKLMQMHGTSMATPNACGNIALLLSGLKAKQIAYTPHSIERSLKNTAKFVEDVDPFAQGPGLLQVDAAFEYLTTNKDKITHSINFAVSIPSRNGARGVYLREQAETSSAFISSVSVVPQFDERTTSETKSQFELRVSLKASDSWIEVGNQLLLTHGGRSFSIRVDPTDLDPGVHFAEVLGCDAANPDRGPLFRLPVTVLKPSELTNVGGHLGYAETLEFQAAHVERRYWNVPSTATWAEFKLTLDADARRTLVFHPRQLAPGEPLRSAGRRKYVTLQPGVERTERIPVRGGYCLELALAQFWASLGASEVKCEITFRGLSPNREHLVLSHDAPVERVDVVAANGAERLSPRAILQTHRTMVLPSKSVISRLKGPRDALPDDRECHRLLLTYNFEQARAGNVTPRFPSIDDLLYESRFGTMIWEIFNKNGRRVTTGDTFSHSAHLRKGSYSLRLELRHTDIGQLEKLKQLPMTLDRPLPGSIALPAYATRADAIEKRNAISPRRMKHEEATTIYFSALSVKPPAGARPGDTLIGTVTYAPTSGNSVTSRPGGYPVTFAVSGPPSNSKPTSPGPSVSNDKHMEQALLEAKFDALKRIPFETKRKLFDKTAKQIADAEADKMRVALLKLERLDHVKHRKKRLPEVIAQADSILKRIDTNALASYFGTKLNGKKAAKRKQMEETRRILVDTLYRKGRALGYMELPDVIKDHPIVDPATHDKAFEDNFAELQKWVDTTEKDYVLLHIRRERRKGRLGAALKLLNKFIATDPDYYWYQKKRRDIYEKLDWTHLWELEKRWLLIRFPNEPLR